MLSDKAQGQSFPFLLLRSWVRSRLDNVRARRLILQLPLLKVFIYKSLTKQAFSFCLVSQRSWNTHEPLLPVDEKLLRGAYQSCRALKRIHCCSCTQCHYCHSLKMVIKCFLPECTFWSHGPFLLYFNVHWFLSFQRYFLKQFFISSHHISVSSISSQRYIYRLYKEDGCLHRDASVSVL